MKLSRVVLGSVVAVSLVGGGLMAMPVAAQDECGVSIYGGDDATSVIDTAAAGNGGVATASANGGAISTGDINSGGNVGNAISVGDTTCFPVFEDVAADVKEEAPAAEEAAVGAAEVVALPDTGVGIGDASALFALISSAGAAAASLGLRRR